MTRQHHFSRYQQPRPCVVCKKLTTGVDGTDLCRPCHDRVSTENEHSDGWHDSEPRSGCHECKAKGGDR